MEGDKKEPPVGPSRFGTFKFIRQYYNKCRDLGFAMPVFNSWAEEFNTNLQQPQLPPADTNRAGINDRKKEREHIFPTRSPQSLKRGGEDIQRDPEEESKFYKPITKAKTTDSSKSKFMLTEGIEEQKTPWKTLKEPLEPNGIHASSSLFSSSHRRTPSDKMDEELSISKSELRNEQISDSSVAPFEYDEGSDGQAVDEASSEDREDQTTVHQSNSDSHNLSKSSHLSSFRSISEKSYLEGSLANLVVENSPSVLSNGSHTHQEYMEFQEQSAKFFKSYHLRQLVLQHKQQYLAIRAKKLDSIPLEQEMGRLFAQVVDEYNSMTKKNKDKSPLTPTEVKVEFARQASSGWSEQVNFFQMLDLYFGN